MHIALVALPKVYHIVAANMHGAQASSLQLVLAVVATGVVVLVFRRALLWAQGPGQDLFSV